MTAPNGNRRPTVSVVIPCFNAEGFAAEAVRSVLFQTLSDIECLVVNDASTDNTAQVLGELARSDQRIKFIDLPTNVGPGASRNIAISESQGEWIALLDADDMMEPTRIERLVQLATKRDADAAMDNLSVRDFDSGLPLYEAFDFLHGQDPLEITQEMFYAQGADFRKKTSIGFMKPIFSRSFLRKTGLKFAAEYRIGEDYLFFAEAFGFRPRFVGINEPLYVYRLRRHSLSKAKPDLVWTLVEMSREIERRCGHRLSPESLRALHMRQRKLTLFAHLGDARRHLGSGEYFRSLSTVMQHPTLITLLPAIMKKSL